MEKLIINIPKGYKVKSFDKETGEIFFEEKPKNIMERIKTIHDAVAELGEYDVEVIEFLKLEKAGIGGHILFYQKAVVIAKALNEGWLPNWNDSNECKYFPWFNMGSSSGGFSFNYCAYWYTNSYVGSSLCFKSHELAEYAGKQFIEIYEKFMIIK